jgi:hypothetical protein
VLTRSQASITQAAKSVTQPAAFSLAAVPSGWRRGPSSASSLALFNHDDSCFVSLDRRSGTIDTVKAQADYQAGLQAHGYKVTAETALSGTFAGGSGPLNYQLQSYQIGGAGSAGAVYPAQALGYLVRVNTYVTLQANCQRADQLPTTTTALNAVTLGF